MPKAHRRKPGRKRKYRFGQLVRRKDDGVIMIVVGYGGVDVPHARDSGHKYRVVEYRPAWRMAIGRGQWQHPWHLEPIESAGIPAFGDHRQMRAVYLANRRLGGRTGRGCDCQCCAHIAIPPGATAHGMFDLLEDELVRSEKDRSGRALAAQTLRMARLRQADAASQVLVEVEADD